MNNEYCPRCYTNEANVFTECSHTHCFNCFIKLKRCGRCYKELIFPKVCKEIRQTYIKKHNLPAELEPEVNNYNNILNNFDRININGENIEIKCFNILRITSGFYSKAYSE